MLGDQFLQGGHQYTVIFWHLGKPEYRSRHFDQLTGLTNTLVLHYQQFYCFPFVGVKEQTCIQLKIL